jgi:IclR family transcriptional regulator, KDG regulon repressor
MVEDRADGGVRSVQLALAVLEAVAFPGDELGITQLADRLSVTKASVHRHLLTQVERGYLVQNSVTARYAIGSKSRLLARFDARQRSWSGLPRGRCANFATAWGIRW